MKVGNLVKVKTEHYGEKYGLIVSVNERRDDGFAAWLIRPFDHPRDIYANPCNVTIISETALCSPLGRGSCQ